MSEHSAALAAPMKVTGRQARSSAAMFNYGTIVAVLVPVPIGLLWVGASMLIYAMHRHHPNPKVGHYVQQAAYRYYGVAGFFTAIAAFIPHGGSMHYYLIAWGLAALILVPWSVYDLVRIYRDQWDDVETVPEESH